MTKQINILGENYTLAITNEREEPRLAGLDGFCDDTAKKLVVDDFSLLNGEATKERLDIQLKENIRHEIVHAFLSESGLADCSDWATNEEIVDWIAMQGLKLYRAWKDAGAVDE